jgi:hypothetical protein
MLALLLWSSKLSKLFELSFTLNAINRMIPDLSPFLILFINLVHHPWLVNTNSWYLTLSCSFLSLQLSTVDHSHLPFFVYMFERWSQLVEWIERSKYELPIPDNSNTIVWVDMLGINVNSLRFKHMGGDLWYLITLSNLLYDQMLHYHSSKSPC